MRRRRRRLQREDRRHHLLHLLLLRAAVAADELFHARRRVLSALDAGVRGRDHDGSARLPDGERGAGVDADEGLLESDRIRPMRLDEGGDAVEDRLQAQLEALRCGRSPPPVVDGLEAPVSCVDDAETARSRPWIDADDFHAATLGSGSDVSFLAARRKNPGMAGTWLTFPDGSEHELADRTAIGRNTENDLVMHSSAVSREHAAVTFRDGRWYLEDRGSFNGTYLNGTRLVPGTPLPLRHADRIGVG